MEQHNVLLYGRERSWRMAQLRETRKNDLLDLPARVTLTSDIHKAVDNSEILLISIGVQSFRGFLRELSCCNLSGKKLVLCMKGLEAETGLRLTEIVRQELGAIPCAVWVGPGHVQDFLRGIPNCMVIDSADAALQDELIRAFSSELIRFYYGGDLTGNEVDAAAKNVIGIAAGLLADLAQGRADGARHAGDQPPDRGHGRRSAQRLRFGASGRLRGDGVLAPQPQPRLW